MKENRTFERELKLFDNCNDGSLVLISYSQLILTDTERPSVFKINHGFIYFARSRGFKNIILVCNVKMIHGDGLGIWQYTKQVTQRTSVCK